jgi:hypothetical protein
MRKRHVTRAAQANRYLDQGQMRVEQIFVVGSL